MPFLLAGASITTTYASEAMRSGFYRCDFTCFLVQDDIFSMWYFDRMGAIHRSRGFRIHEHPQLLLLLTIAVARASLKDFGSEPMIAPAEGEGPPRPDVVYTGPNPQHDLRGHDLFAQIRELYMTHSLFEYPLLDWTKNALRIEQVVDVSDSWPFATEPPPSSAVDASPPSILSAPGTISFPFTGGPLDAQPGGIGRGTVVYPLSPPTDVDGYDPEERFVAKFSWQILGRASEAGILRYIRKSIPARWRNHVTEVKCSRQASASAMELPRVVLVEDTQARVAKRSILKDLDDKSKVKSFDEVRDAFIGSEIEERESRVLVTPEYSSLNKVKNKDEFMSVFKDVVKGAYNIHVGCFATLIGWYTLIVHYVIYKRTGILHRDLSVNNIMFLRRQGRVFGILNDWDLAAPETRTSPKTSEPRIGTAAYMAIRLLKSPDGSVQHQYCYDLESFAWILIWCAFVFCFDSVEVSFEKRPNTIQTWTGETDWETIASSKILFLNDDVDESLVGITTAMKALESCWIAPVLEKMISTWHNRRLRKAKGPIEDNFFQFEAFMQVLEPEVGAPEKALWSDEDSTSA